MFRYFRIVVNKLIIMCSKPGSHETISNRQTSGILNFSKFMSLIFINLVKN